MPKNGGIHGTNTTSSGQFQIPSENRKTEEIAILLTFLAEYRLFKWPKFR
jgi:hypothetical protein